MILIDDTLDRFVADALRLVEFNVSSVYEVFDRRDRVLDPEIIAWLSNLKVPGVWVHADNRAKKQHRALIISSQISTIWVIRPKGAMSGKHQLRLLSWVIPNVLDDQAPFARPFHFRVDEHGDQARPRPRIRPYQL